MNQSTHNPSSKMVDDCLSAWHAGVRAVDPAYLISQFVSVDQRKLEIGDQVFDLGEIERIRVVGAGKAGRAMISGVYSALGSAVVLEKRVSGWVNVPATNSNTGNKHLFGQSTGRALIWPFPARPYGENLPTQDCYAGTLLIKDIVERTSPKEICLGLFSGGGSALLTQPAKTISLEDMRSLILWMTSSGASIKQLNTVRKQISQVKGGRLVKSFKGKQFTSLLLSDVIHDARDLIASGPTVQDNGSPDEAIEVLKQFDSKLKSVPRSILKHLKRRSAKKANSNGTEWQVRVPTNVTNIVIGNIETAMDGAEQYLKELGYQCVREIQADENELAEDAGKKMARWILERGSTTKPIALISGGEPVVKLCNNPGTGGRNQQLVLAALAELNGTDCDNSTDFALLSAGTDGEDGNSPRAGAFLDKQSLELTRAKKLDIAGALRRNDAHPFFSDKLGRGEFSGSGRSETNVCDLRIVLVAPNAAN